jgi:tetratricopeptide (TPR) repeat protein
VLLSLGDYEGALDDYNRSLERQPRIAFVRKRRAKALFHLGRYAEALADLKQALERNPNDTSTLVSISPALVGECPDESFRKGLLELADTAAERLHGPRARISLYLGLNALDKARANFADVHVRKMQYYDYYQHALLCLVTDEVAKYRASCEMMQERLADPQDPIAAHFTAWTCALVPEAVENYERAITLADRAVQMAPQSDQYLNSLGAILYRAGRTDEAIKRLGNWTSVWRIRMPGRARPRATHGISSLWPI